MKLKFEARELQWVKTSKEIDVDKYQYIDSWIRWLEKCPKCGSNFEHEQKVVAVINHGKIYFFHETCFEKAIEG